MQLCHSCVALSRAVADAACTGKFSDTENSSYIQQLILWLLWHFLPHCSEQQVVALSLIPCGGVNIPSSHLPGCSVWVFALLNVRAEVTSSHLQDQFEDSSQYCCCVLTCCLSLF